MVLARTSVLSLGLALGLVAAACGGGGSSSSGGGSPTTTTHSQSSTTSSTTSETTTSTSSATLEPPVLMSLMPAATTGGGLILGWTEPNPCDTVEIEREDLINPYPSQSNPPKSPQFSTAGSNLSYADTTATDTNTSYTYHARCVVSGTTSVWSNEVSHAGH
jgi:hypothetical protein